jgi:hypothetical protein
LVRVLAGRRAGRKLTPQIEAYVRARWADLSRSETYGIGKPRSVNGKSWIEAKEADLVRDAAKSLDAEPSPSG